MKPAKMAAISSSLIALLGLLAIAAFYFEQHAETLRIHQQKPTYTRFDPAAGKYVDYDPAKE